MDRGLPFTTRIRDPQPLVMAVKHIMEKAIPLINNDTMTYNPHQPH